MVSISSAALLKPPKQTSNSLHVFTFILICTLFCPSSANTLQSNTTFINIAADAGIDFEHTDGNSELRLFNEYLGAGGGFFDYNNDGHLDIYLVNGARQTDQHKHIQSSNPTNALYRNNGDGTFSNVTGSTGVGDTGYGVGAAVGDYDNDGDLDLYVTNFGSNAFYRNNGDATFDEVSLNAGVANIQWGTSCAFADVNNDGYLDLYISNYADYAIERDKRCVIRGIWQYCGPGTYPPDTDVLYHNNGDGTFSDVSNTSGVLNVPPYHGLGVVFGDYDNDGDQDVYVANDQDANFLFRNRGDGAFDEVALSSGVGYSDMGKEEAGMGTAFGDYDNDGMLDLTVSNFQNETNTLYHNQSGDYFVDETITSGIGEVTYSYLGWGISFFDYDNDGYKDIFVANGHVLDNIAEIDRSTTYPQQNLLFRNLGDGTFADVTNQAGPGLGLRKVSRGAAFGDYDNDGDIDILITNWNQTADLLRNDGGNQNNWVQFRAVGVNSNRSAIGARIKVTSGKLSQYADVQCGGSYLSFNDLRVHFGLGKSEKVDFIETRWPSGKIDSADNLTVNRLYVVTEGHGLSEYQD